MRYPEFRRSAAVARFEGETLADKLAASCEPPTMEVGMELLETEIEGRLSDSSEEYRRLSDRHREYEQQLEHIANRRPFTQQDWFEEAVVKKQKLLVKDRLEALTRTVAEVSAEH
jgi:uncharacterized protein YdcH (DUF465 family)